MPTSAPANLYGLSGSGYTTDAGGRRIDGRRVLDVQDAQSGFNEQLADQLGFGDLWRQGYTPRIRGSLFDDPDVQAEAFSPELAEKLSQYELARLGYGNDLRQHAVVDRTSGNVVGAFAPKKYSGFGDFVKMAAPIMLGAMPGLGAALGGALGASGTAATAVGNGLISGGLSAANGGDFLRGALTGGLTSLAMPTLTNAGNSVGSAVGGGAFGDALSRATTGGLRSGLGGLLNNGSVNPQSMLISALRGGLNGPLGGTSNSLAPGASYNFDDPESVQAPQGDGGGDEMPDDFDSYDSRFYQPDFGYGSQEAPAEYFNFGQDMSFPEDGDPYDRRFYRPELELGSQDAPADVLGYGSEGGLGSLLSQLLNRGGNMLSGVLQGNTGALNQLGALLGAYGQYRQAGRSNQTPSQLMASLPGANTTMAAAQRAANERLLALPMTQPTVASGASALQRYGVDPTAPRYAEGGDVMGGLSAMMGPEEAPEGMMGGGGEELPPELMAMLGGGGASPQGALGLVSGPGGGQDDNITAQLSPGEYVMDADVVSALGDGSNEAGAAKLDALREAVRAHKRSAPVGKIPPKARSIDAYLE